MKHSDYIYRVKLHHDAFTKACQICHGSWREIGCSCNARFCKEIAPLITAGIPEKYWPLTLQNIKPSGLKHILPIIKTYLSNLDTNLRTGRGIYMSSEAPSSGKSTLSFIIGKEAILQNKQVYVSDLNECSTMLSPRADHPQEMIESKFLEKRMKESDLLIFDNIGTNSSLVSAPAYKKDQFTTVVIDRVGRNKSTIINGNLKPDRLTDIFGLPFYEAFKNSATFITLTNEGISL